MRPIPLLAAHPDAARRRAPAQRCAGRAVARSAHVAGIFRASVSSLSSHGGPARLVRPLATSWTYSEAPSIGLKERIERHHLQGFLAMRMRGLEPPPDFSDTDLNRTHPSNMRPLASSLSILSGFVDPPDASDDTSVAKVLPRSHRDRLGERAVLGRRNDAMETCSLEPGRAAAVLAGANASNDAPSGRPGLVGLQRGRVSSEA